MSGAQTKVIFIAVKNELKQPTVIVAAPDNFRLHVLIRFKHDRAETRQLLVVFVLPRTSFVLALSMNVFSSACERLRSLKEYKKRPLESFFFCREPSCRYRLQRRQVQHAVVHNALVVALQRRGKCNSRMPLQILFNFLDRKTFIGNQQPFVNLVGLNE